jgi:hypothetical protein
MTPEKPKVEKTKTFLRGNRMPIAMTRTTKLTSVLIAFAFALTSHGTANAYAPRTCARVSRRIGALAATPSPRRAHFTPLREHNFIAARVAAR